MKISEMSTNKAADAIVRISAHLSNILDDGEMMEVIKTTASTGTENAMNGWANLLTKVVPICLEKHRNDLFSIVAVLDNKTAEQVGEMKLIKTLNILKESVDKELLDFFGSFTTRESTGEK